MLREGGQRGMERSPHSRPKGASFSLDLLSNCMGKGISLYQPNKKSPSALTQMFI